MARTWHRDWSRSPTALRDWPPAAEPTEAFVNQSEMDALGNGSVIPNPVTAFSLP